MTIGIAAFLTFSQDYYAPPVVARYQNYWSGEIVDDHTFYPFTVDAIISNTTGGQQSLTVVFAIGKSIVYMVEAALTAGYLAEVSFYRFSPSADGTPPAQRTLFATFIGEVIGASINESSISMQIGASLDPVNAQAPPRKFTTTLVGEPPKV